MYVSTGAAESFQLKKVKNQKEQGDYKIDKRCSKKPLGNLVFHFAYPNRRRVKKQLAYALVKAVSSSYIYVV